MSPLDQALAKAETILAQCLIAANQAAAAAASIGAAGLAPLDSPAFTGTPTAPTPPSGDASNRVSTTAFLGSKLGQPSGIATLDTNGKVLTTQMPFTGLNFKGSWNANTNTPTLLSGTGTAGDFYIVSVAGNTNLSGINSWSVGDQALFNGTAWTKIPYTAPPLSNVPLSSLEGIPSNTWIGNTAGGSASPSAYSLALLKNYMPIAIGDSGAGGSAGFVPAPPPGSAGSGAFLRADMVFAVIPAPDLSAYAPLNSPSFTGTPTTATIARGTYSTAIATTMGIANNLSGTAPSEVVLIQMNGTGAASGTSNYGARVDHIHPRDTGVVPVLNGSATNLAILGLSTIGGTLTQTGVHNGTVSGAVTRNGAMTINGTLTLNGSGQRVNGTITIDSIIATLQSAVNVTVSGTMTVPTLTQGDNSNNAASTAFVATAIGTVGAAAGPGTPITLFDGTVTINGTATFTVLLPAGKFFRIDMCVGTFTESFTTSVVMAIGSSGTIGWQFGSSGFNGSGIQTQVYASFFPDMMGGNASQNHRGSGFQGTDAGAQGGASTIIDRFTIKNNSGSQATCRLVLVGYKVT